MKLIVTKHAMRRLKERTNENELTIIQQTLEWCIKKKKSDCIEYISFETGLKLRTTQEGDNAYLVTIIDTDSVIKPLNPKAFRETNHSKTFDSIEVAK